MNLTLTTARNADATVGALLAGAVSFYTIERTTACVPAGVYDLVPYDSPTHGQTWCLRNAALKIMGADQLTADQLTDGYRNFCELHNGNYARQSDGCLLVGFADQPMLDDMTGFVVPAVEESVDAFTALRQLLTPGSIGHTLTITREETP